MIGLIVQARSASTRFPGKITADLDGKPMLEHVLMRCAAARNVETLVVALPKNDPAEMKVRKFAAKHGFDVYVPVCEPDDVLARFYKTAIAYHMDIIVRITGDCPLIDPAIIDLSVGNYGINRNSTEYVTNTMLRVHPRGMDVEVFSFNALKAAFDSALNDDAKTAKYDMEHVTPHIRRYPKLYTHQDVMHPHVRDRNALKLRLCVDYPEDLELVKAIHKACKGQTHWQDRPADMPQEETKELPIGQYPMFGLLNILAAYEKNPTWININGKYKQAG